jgi:hypothetical protein
VGREGRRREGGRGRERRRGREGREGEERRLDRMGGKEHPPK